MKELLKIRWEFISSLLEESIINFISKYDEVSGRESDIYMFTFYCYSFSTVMGLSMKGQLWDYHNFISKMPIELYRAYNLKHDEYGKQTLRRVIENISNMKLQSWCEDDDLSTKVYLASVAEAKQYALEQLTFLKFSSPPIISLEPASMVERDKAKLIIHLCSKRQFYPEKVNDMFLYIFDCLYKAPKKDNRCIFTKLAKRILKKR